MGDKMKDMEERLDKLENSLKLTFMEIEKRLESMTQEQPVNIEDRLQELEDLLLLIQLEITKLKDRSGPLDFGISTGAPDIHERMSKIEETVMGGELKHAGDESKAKLGTDVDDETEKRLRTLEESIGQHHKFVTEQKKVDVVGRLDEIDKRLASVENKKLVSDKGVIISRKDVLDDVKKILFA